MKCTENSIRHSGGRYRHYITFYAKRPCHPAKRSKLLHFTERYGLCCYFVFRIRAELNTVSTERMMSTATTCHICTKPKSASRASSIFAMTTIIIFCTAVLCVLRLIRTASARRVKSCVITSTLAHFAVSREPAVPIAIPTSAVFSSSRS